MDTIERLLMKILKYISSTNYKPTNFDGLILMFEQQGYDKNIISESLEELDSQGLIIFRSIHGWIDLDIRVRKLLQKYPEIVYPKLLEIWHDEDLLLKEFEI